MKKGIFKLSVKYDKSLDYTDIKVIKSIFEFLTEDKEQCKLLKDIYDMNKQTPLIKHAVERTDRIINAYVNSRFCDEPTNKLTNNNNDTNKSNLIQELSLNSPFSAVNKLEPTNTARNIVDVVVSQLIDSLSPLTCEIEDKVIEDYLDNIMYDTSWEIFLKNSYEELLTMGIGAVLVQITDSLESVYLENIPVYHCAFVVQGGSVRYSYYKTDSQLLIYTDREVIEYSIDRDKYRLIGAISHIGGQPLLQPFVFQKNKGIFETCLGDIGAYDMAYFVPTHALSDPKNTILSTPVDISKIGMSNAIELDKDTKWVSKPTADLIALCENVRNVALENIVEDTQVIPEKLMMTNIKTATQSLELLNKMNSLLRATSNMFKQRFKPLLFILESIAKVKLNKVIEIDIQPSYQEVNSYLEDDGILSIKEKLRIRRYSDTKIDSIYEEILEEIKDKEEARMGVLENDEPIDEPVILTNDTVKKDEEDTLVLENE